jgi:hypothetical protein
LHESIASCLVIHFEFDKVSMFEILTVNIEKVVYGKLSCLLMELLEDQ